MNISEFLAPSRLSFRFLKQVLATLFLAIFLPATHANTIPNGGHVEGSIVTITGTDTHTFEATAGKPIFLRIADTGQNSFVPYMHLYAPDGTLVDRSGGANWGDLWVTAPATGTYSVVVSNDHQYNNGSYISTYALYLVTVPGANEHGELINGAAVEGTIELGDLDTYTFTADAGEPVFLRIADTEPSAFYPYLYVYGPTGALVQRNGGAAWGDIWFYAPTAGAYTVVVSNEHQYADGSYVGHYALEFARVPGANELGELNNGGVRTGTIALGGLDSYTFPATAGEPIHMRIADATANSFVPYWYIYSPTGVLVDRGGGAHWYGANFTAGETGIYTVVVANDHQYADTSYVGQYALNFVRVPGANEGGAVFGNSVVTDQIDIGDIDSYTFQGTAGAVVTVTVTDLDSNAFSPQVWLYKPTGQQLGYVSANDVATMSRTLDADGTYTVVIVNSHQYATSAYAGRYSLTVTGIAEASDADVPLPAWALGLLGAAMLSAIRRHGRA